MFIFETASEINIFNTSRDITAIPQKSKSSTPRHERDISTDTYNDITT